MIYLSEPDGFSPVVEVSSCFLEHDGKILFLLRSDHKSEPNTWCVPAGKIEKKETPEQAAIREMREETGIMVRDVKYFGKVFVRYPEYDFVYHMFHSRLTSEPDIILSGEHKAFRWVTPEEALTLPLIRDEDACIRLFFKLA